MNTKTFYTKEFFFLSVPVMLVDLAIHIGIFEWMLSWFSFTATEDYVLTRPRSLYFLIVGFIIAMVLVPVRLHDRTEEKHAMMNIGTRPTFNGHYQTLETHIFQLHEDLYDQLMLVSFIERLRDEQRFDSIDALQQQLHADKDAAEAALNKSHST